MRAARVVPSIFLLISAALLAACSSSGDSKGNSPGTAGAANGGGQSADAGTGGQSNGGQGTGTGGTSTGGAPASGGSAGSISATGGQVAVEAGAGGSAGAGGNEAGAGGTSGAIPLGRCDWQGSCNDCFQSSKSGACAVLDNPCNDDSSCDPTENTWTDCICGSNGDTTAAAACDKAFSDANGQVAQTVIDCARQNCTGCYAAGFGCKLQSSDCSSCAPKNCDAAVAACRGDSTCKDGNDTLFACVCSAQKGNAGTVGDCISAFETAGGKLATDLVSCISSKCGAECGL